MAAAGQAHVKANYNFEKYERDWVETMDDIIERHGSWDTRQGYKKWHFMEVA